MKNIIGMQKLSVQSINNEMINEICKVNDEISEYGLCVTKKDAKELIKTRDESLSKTGRIEFKNGVINQIIKKFAMSPYIMKSNYIDTFCELVWIFYEYKNETLEVLGDEELLDLMVEYFNNYCQGSLELLEGKALYKLAENIRMEIKNPFDISNEKDQ